ncbi:Thiol-disulfide interchange protein, contains DsbC and DsbD domains [Bosea lupini]|uniref:Thiol-disulfide interchange protein, contains DsbC and DsbD domains n=1 Tax=Bosea lupini TaxID=1036779 RepID=A0A1H7LXF9_9HYPH|nr:protein-disulfide reductase DsbD domain-containing protein [Bosea lupini]SEL02997.1 Thiol-disulfide interchange protein, contains DsbC and DsbD domains [Bosea lupini]
MKTVTPLSFLAALTLGAPASAQDAAVSPWSKAAYSSMRLIAGATAPSGKQRVGVEITMSPGFKTYWRSPGDAGVPPVFDWSGSENVGGLDVRWPTPERFDDGAGSGIGYVGDVVVPVSVQPIDPTRPVTVVLKLDYAVCDKICVPAKGEARLWLEPGVTSVTSPRLEQFEARIPHAVKLGAADDRLSILEVTHSDAAVKLVLKAPEGGSVDDVFVEGAGMWSFGRAMLMPQPDGTVAAKLRIVERPKGATGPTPLIITVRGKPQSVETRLELDIGNAKP